jgi:hypothetical protein
VEQAGADGVLGGVVGPVVGWALEAAGEAAADDAAEEAEEAAPDGWLPAALLLLLVDPQAAARAPVHSRAAAALTRRAAWADGLIGGSLVRRGCCVAGDWRGGGLAWRGRSPGPQGCPDS